MGGPAAVDALACVRLFQGLSPKDLGRVADMTKELTFQAGQAITEETEEGESGGRFYVLVEGDADVLLGKDVVKTLGAGDYFGEISLIDGSPRTATISARAPVRTLSLSSWNFRPLLKEHPSIREAVLLEMCRRLRQAESSHLH
ncbi:MAG: cyclic nucleotide-binding domain-containing protein [Acidimicrobiia bacterium]|nr:cyclic nucleotide-binding domain-containing protein [Acidimicrobiia bacterium]